MKEEKFHRSAEAIWTGRLKDGRGELTTASQILNLTPYSFSTRFGTQSGTNPEELIAAAHAGCFTMALANELEKAGVYPIEIETRAIVFLENKDGWTIGDVHLEVWTPNRGNEDKVKAAAETAKNNCPVSKLLKANITMNIDTTDLKETISA